MTDKQEYAIFVAQITRATDPSLSGGYVQVRCADLARMAKRLHRIFENQCNGFQTWDGKWDEEAEKRADKAEERTCKRMVDILAELFPNDGAKIEFQGDPRGYVAKIILASSERLSNGDVRETDKIGIPS